MSPPTAIQKPARTRAFTYHVGGAWSVRGSHALVRFEKHLVRVELKKVLGSARSGIGKTNIADKCV